MSSAELPQFPHLKNGSGLVRRSLFLLHMAPLLPQAAPPGRDERMFARDRQGILPAALRRNYRRRRGRDPGGPFVSSVIHRTVFLHVGMRGNRYFEGGTTQ